MKTLVRRPTSRVGKALATLAVIGAAGAFAGTGAWSAFSSTTQNDGNSISAGTVVIGDNDANAAMYTLSDQAPAGPVEKCIKVTYTGSLDATVKLYTTSTVGALGPYVNLTITPGTQASSTFPDCTGFSASGSAIFSGTLSAFQAAHPDYANGLATNPAAGHWETNDAIVYKFTVQLADDDAAQGLSTGAHSFVWQARNS